MTRRWVILVPAITIPVVYAIAFAGFVIDDAYITFAYSRNFADSGHLVLRPGNYVEANSSFLWSILLGGLSSISANPVLWSKIVGVVAQIGCIFSEHNVAPDPTAPAGAIEVRCGIFLETSPKSLRVISISA